MSVDSTIVVRLDSALLCLLAYSSTMQKRKKTNTVAQASLPRDMLAANNFCVVGFPTAFSLSKTSNGNGVLALKYQLLT